MIGVHHIYNCLTAAGVGLTLGIDLTTVVRGLESIGQVPGRLERIECGQPFGVFVDYARNARTLRRRAEKLCGLSRRDGLFACWTRSRTAKLRFAVRSPRLGRATAC